MKYDEHPFGDHLPSIHELTDASNECRHGRLPFDAGPRCGCWQISWRPKVKPVPVKRVPVKRPSHPWKHPWTVRRRAIRLRAQGMSYERAAGVVGVAPNSVRRWVLAVERQEAA